MSRYSQEKYEEQSHPNNSGESIYVCVDDSLNFTVKDKPGTWKFYYGQKLEGEGVDKKKVRDGHPCVLCKCGYSTRYQYDLVAETPNAEIKLDAVTQTVWSHPCGNCSQKVKFRKRHKKERLC